MSAVDELTIPAVDRDTERQDGGVYTHPAPRLLSEREAARYLGIGTRKMWELGNRGEHGDPVGIPRVRIGRSVRYDRIDLLAWIDRRRVGRR